MFELTCMVPPSHNVLHHPSRISLIRLHFSSISSITHLLAHTHVYIYIYILYIHMCKLTISLFHTPKDYLTVHGSDALFAAKEIFHTMGVLKYLGGERERMPSVAIRRMLYESMLRDLLLVRQYRVEVYENKGASRGNQWHLIKKASFTHVIASYINICVNYWLIILCKCS